MNYISRNSATELVTVLVLQAIICIFLYAIAIDIYNPIYIVSFFVIPSILHLTKTNFFQAIFGLLTIFALFLLTHLFLVK